MYLVLTLMIAPCDYFTDNRFHLILQTNRGKCLYRMGCYCLERKQEVLCLIPMGSKLQKWLVMYDHYKAVKLSQNVHAYVSHLEKK